MFPRVATRWSLRWPTRSAGRLPRRAPLSTFESNRSVWSLGQPSRPYGKGVPAVLNITNHYDSCTTGRQKIVRYPLVDHCLVVAESQDREVASEAGNFLGRQP